MHKCDNYPRKAKRAHHCHFKSNKRCDLITIIDHLSGSLRSPMLLTAAYNSSWSLLITESGKNQYCRYPESSCQPFQRRNISWKNHIHSDLSYKYIKARNISLNDCEGLAQTLNFLHKIFFYFYFFFCKSNIFGNLLYLVTFVTRIFPLVWS